MSPEESKDVKNTAVLHVLHALCKDVKIACLLAHALWLLKAQCYSLPHLLWTTRWNSTA